MGRRPRASALVERALHGLGCTAWRSVGSHHLLFAQHSLERRPNAAHIGPDAIQVLQDHFESAASNVWRLKDDSVFGKEVFRRMESGALIQSETPLVACIDIEADIHSGRVFQIGICDLEGQRLLDCQTVLSEEEVVRTYTPPGSTAERMQRTFDESARSRTSVHGFLDVGQVAARLKELFPYPT